MNEVVDALNPRDGGRYLDGTFGAGGYTVAMLDRANCRVIAIDRDPDAVAAGQGIAVTYAQWTSAVLFNGLSRYEEALTVARQASDDTPGNYVAMWALPELAEAAARSGQPDEAAGAVARGAGAARTPAAGLTTTSCTSKASECGSVT